MAKKVRFPLEMEDGAEVRSVEELREHFSLERVLTYIADGKMISWLRDRYEDDLAEAVEVLDSSDPLLSQKVCRIFGVSCEISTEIDMEILAERSRKLTLLKEFTADSEILAHVDDVAVTQDDIYDLLDEGKTEIYLCGEQFTIPLAKQGIRYIGVNQPVVVVRSSEPVDWEKKKIVLVGVRYDTKYQSIVDSVEVMGGKLSDTNQSEDEEVRSDFYIFNENFRTKGIYGLKGSEFQFIHANTGDDYSPDLNYSFGMAQDGENLYLSREKEPYSKTYELVRLNTSSDTWVSLYDLGSRKLQIVDKKKNFLYFFDNDLKYPRIMVLDINTFKETNINIEGKPDSGAFCVSDSGKQIYFLDSPLRGMSSIRMIDVEKGTTEIIYKNNGIRNFSLCKDEIILCGYDYEHQGEKDHPIYVLALNLITRKTREICQQKDISWYHIRMVAMFGENLYLLRDDKCYDHRDYFELWLVDLKQEKKMRKIAERIETNIGRFFGSDMKEEMWIQDEYLYIGIRNSNRFPMYRLHLPTNRLEKIRGFKYEAV